jgi:hypothetical protein
MKYEKPQLVEVARANEAIQSGKKGTSTVSDNPQALTYTIGAYEADE